MKKDLRGTTAEKYRGGKKLCKAAAKAKGLDEVTYSIISFQN